MTWPDAFVLVAFIGLVILVCIGPEILATILAVIYMRRIGKP